MGAKGESRHQAKERARAEGKQRDYYTKNKIYSEQTMQNYLQFSNRLLAYAQKTEPDINKLEDLKKYVEPYLNELIDKGRSAWTISSYLAAYNKLFQSEKSDYNLKDYQRNVNDTKKNRGEKEVRYNPENYRSELLFSRCFGLRASELKELYIGQVTIENGKITNVYVKQGKGGRPRNVSFYGSKEEQEQIIKDIEEKKEKGYKKLFPSFTKELKVHRERQEYAKRCYRANARDVSQLERSEITIPKKGVNKGEKYDKKALETASKALGHTRINVVYQNYLSA